MSDDEKPLSDGSLFYTMVIFARNGEEAGRKRIRIYPNRDWSDGNGSVKGMELARDAMAHAGFKF